MVLVDSSVWIDHFRKKNSNLSELLEAEKVLIHPFVLGELACGNLQHRTEIIALLHALPVSIKAEDDEVLFFIERHNLMGRGIGLVDIHLLASCFMQRCYLWTKDKRLHVIATDMKIGISQQ
ncbi:MAG: PIN domain-containing protein [Kiritimatiellae bacterium]|nr:PIN domain-containing protein [Kiritimatiellia bacterium]